MNIIIKSLSMICILSSACVQAALIENGDFSSATSSGDNNYIESFKGTWGIKNTWAPNGSNATQTVSGSNGLRGLAQVNEVTTQSGDTLTVEFDWTPSSSAVTDSLSLSYTLYGWTGVTGTVAGTETMINSLNGQKKSKASAIGGGRVVDLFTGTASSVGGSYTTASNDILFATGIAGTTTNYSHDFDLSTYDVDYDDVSDYDYIGIRFFKGVQGVAYEDTTGGIIDNVQLSAGASGVVVTNKPPATSGDNEADFFTDTIGLVDTNVNLVVDYGASGSDTNDDSVALQTAIDFVTTLPNGGKISIPDGTFYFINILLKDNVHLAIDAGATIIPTTTNGTVFKMGLAGDGVEALDTINNTSIRGVGGRYTVILTNTPPSTIKMAVFNCKNVDNFMVSDFYILDNYTRLSSMTLNTASHSTNYFRPRHGVVKNGDVLNGHYGYGLIQAQTGYNILFKNLYGTGGITLRLETGAVQPDVPYDINLDYIYGKNITNTNGHGGLLMGPHSRSNGFVSVDGIITVGSLFGGEVGKGFVNAEEAALGLVAGTFAPGSIVKNVHSVYGTNAQYKTKNVKLLPCALRSLINTNGFAWDPSTIYEGPSIYALKNNDPEITVSNVTMEGFFYQPQALLTDEPWQTLDGTIDDLHQGCNPIPVSGISLSQTNLSLYVSKSAYIGASVAPASATDTNVNWISDDPSVAIVSESGLITAVGAGTATITARTVDWGWFDTCAVTVSGSRGGSWTQLSSNDFELGWGNWESGNTNDVFLSTNNAIGTQCVNMQDDTATAYMALSNAMDLTPYTQLKIEFSLLSIKFNPSHELVLEYSDDGGSTWTIANNLLYDFEFDNGAREAVSLIIDAENQNFTTNVKVRIRCNAGFDGDDAYIDNVVISGFAQSPWGTFVGDYDLSGSLTDDNDMDLLSDWSEYVIGGNPTNPADLGLKPVFDATSSNYVFFLVGDSSIDAYVLTNSGLVGGNWGTNRSVTVTSTNGLLSGYTNTIDTSKDKLFIKLLVE